MKFRNFDKIGLETEEEIKKFLGDEMITNLVGTEASKKDFLSKRLNKFGIEAEVKNDLVVSLLNKESNTDLPLLCLIYFTTHNNEICATFDTSDCVTRMGYPFIFNTLDDALKYTDNLYGAESNFDTFERTLQRKGEGESE